MADTFDTMDPEAFLDAGEYVLGVLEGEELSRARRAMLTDPAFAQAAEWWGIKLGAMGEAREPLAPSSAVWPAIERRLDGLDESTATPIPAARRGPSGWSIATALSGFAAAAAALVLFLQTPAQTPVAPAPTPAPVPAAGERLVVQLQSEDGERGLAGVIDSRGGRIALSSTNLVPGDGKIPELWVIPEGGTPISLGAIAPDGSFARDLSPQEQALLKPGVTLAVTFEENSGARHESPTMPIIVAGAMAEV